MRAGPGHDSADERARTKGRPPGQQAGGRLDADESGSETISAMVLGSQSPLGVLGSPGWRDQSRAADLGAKANDAYNKAMGAVTPP